MPFSGELLQVELRLGALPSSLIDCLVSEFFIRRPIGIFRFTPWLSLAADLTTHLLFKTGRRLACGYDVICMFELRMTC